ncbi:Mu transposase C-terminal domain-containing protein [Marilutibacter chinensis]|uniref:Mu transposase C-terminal domain-containing protein n=1 Tax=Marilutibacter chinensis TaxID=2912247 RepID=A0ABS9HTV8_9GAMM|nr:Mu transposase C-terminal domain-containing protein [Lysobacter chinensis]MCF7221600.1 Mu transposase C-terminal domain-containing protein [Lysobacter chinensis]
MVHDPLEFMASFLPAESRVLKRTGVEIHRLQYWDNALAPWVGRRESVLVHYDPRDITYVYVRTPGGVLVKAGVTTPGVSAISLAEWSARRQHEQATCNDPTLVEQADASLLRNNRFLKETKASLKKVRRDATAAAGDRFRDTSCPSLVVKTESIDETPVLSGAPIPYEIEEIDYDI